MDIFNKDEKIIQYCLAREYTTFVNDQEHFKDLRILNRDLVTTGCGADDKEKTFILDNTPLVYSYNVNNAVPISTYKGGKDDKEVSEWRGVQRSCLLLFLFSKNLQMWRIFALRFEIPTS